MRVVPVVIFSIFVIQIFINEAEAKMNSGPTSEAFELIDQYANGLVSKRLI